MASEQWIDNFEKDFKSFTDDEKIRTIEVILKLSGPVQLRFLSSKLQVLVKRDFIKFLPTELSFNILKFLDYKTINRCCIVSKDWNKIVSRYGQVWIDACKKLGVVNGEEEAIDTNSWKSMLRNALRRIKRFRHYRSFGFAKRELVGHTERVTALCYKDGLLASGSNDRTVRLWDVASGDCKGMLTCHTCADLKFDQAQVVTASCDNTLARWEWSTGNCLTKYQGHVGAVFCVDYNTEMDLVVSGSSDCTVKIWQMSTGRCLATKLGHQEWLISVLLPQIAEDCQTVLQRKDVAISMSKESIKEFVPHYLNCNCKLIVNPNHARKVWSISASDEYCCIATMSTSSEDSPVYEYRPKLLCNGWDIICSSNDGICIWSLETLQLKRLFKKPDFLLVAFGNIFTVCWKSNMLHILNNSTEECLCEMPAPWSKASSGCRFNDCSGDVAWLNDCSAHVENGPIYFARSDEKIVVLQWSINSDVVNGVMLSLEEMAKNSVRP